jgi:mono/diheme cytochrome c family protein
MKTLPIILLAAIGQGCMLHRAAVLPASGSIVAMTSARIARGRYLFESVADCNGCHSPRDYGRLGAPVIPAGRGQGARMLPEPGIPGTLVAPNITPDPETGIGRWTDGEKIRAIRDGIGRDGRALFPMMPYTGYRQMSDEDVQSLVAYMNTLPPVRNPLPRSRVNLLAAGYVKSWPRPVGIVPEADRANPVRYGEYLVSMASCVSCHTTLRLGRPRHNRLFAGGRLFDAVGGKVRSPNITPDPETGIGKWSEQDFLNRFQLYRRYVENGSPKLQREGPSPMPWLGLSQLEPADLRAIYAYLRTVTPVRNPVRSLSANRN